MKFTNKKKGFTLVELLAVIIVLAIIMLIAVQSALPLIGQARSGAFVSSANVIMSAVESAVIADEINGKRFTCYSVDYLIDKGYIEKIKKAPAGANPTTGYIGYVTINRTAEHGGTIKYDYNAQFHDLATGFIIYKMDSGAPITEPFTGEDIVSTGTVSRSCPTGGTHNPAQ